MTDTLARATTAFTVSPDDAAQALRMGWTLAEVRGRLNPGCTYAPVAGVEAAPALALETAQERNPVEGQVEATKILSALGGLDLLKIDIATLSRDGDWDAQMPSGRPTLKTPDMLRFLVYRIICTRAHEKDPPDHTFDDLNATMRTKRIEPTDDDTTSMELWDRLQWFLWAWDEALQDQLAAGNFGTASSYELGRGLSECYWGAMSATSSRALKEHWRFVLGENRVSALNDLCSRLAPVFNSYSAPAVRKSLGSWKDIAALSTWGIVQADVAKSEDECRTYRGAMQQQARIWRDLLVTGRDPLTLVAPSRMEAVARDPRPIFKAFRWELGAAATLVVGLILTLIFASNWARTALAVLAAAGITASAVLSWIKSQAQSVATRVGTAVNQSVVNDAVDKGAKLLPPKPWWQRLRHPPDDDA